MLYQVKRGGRFFLPAFIRNKLTNLAPNIQFIEEAKFIENYKNVQNNDCIICLQSLIKQNEIIEVIKANDSINSAISDNDHHSDNNNSQAAVYFNKTNQNSPPNLEDAHQNQFIVELNEQNNCNKTNILKTVKNKYNEITLSEIKETMTKAYFKSIEILIILYKILFTFHEYDKIKNNYNNKPLAVTRCNHVFHTTCILDWLKNKTECPVDRTRIIHDI